MKIDISSREWSWIYVSIKLNDETHKHIEARLNKNSFRRYLTINEIFDDLKKIYVDLNKMQTTMNVFIRLTQMSKYAKFDVFWNEFQRLMKKMNLCLITDLLSNNQMWGDQKWSIKWLLTEVWIIIQKYCHESWKQSECEESILKRIRSFENKLII
jgi:hypothetical protein